MTALIATTTSEAISVSLSAATAWGVGDRVPERAQPPSVDFATTAASGISTIRLR